MPHTSTSHALPGCRSLAQALLRALDCNLYVHEDELNSTLHEVRVFVQLPSLHCYFVLYYLWVA